MNLSSLNPEQKSAVTDYQGPMLILAGAGTGKTRVITYRIAHMLSQGVPANQIVALSFTNKAAREMAERVHSLGGTKSKDVWLGTFHSYCLFLLRRYYQAAGLTARFGLAGTSDQLDLVRKALEEKNWAGLYDASELLTQIGRAKNALLVPSDLREGSSRWDGAWGDAALLAEVYSLYERQLRLNRVIDFDDCILKVVLMLRAHPDIRQEVRGIFRYLLVDEFQDTNSAQLAVMEQLASDNHDVCVVGDDDQSIYSWRGAVYEILEQFEALFPKTKMIKLEQNYRCPQLVLNAANGIIRNNTQRKDKTLWSARSDDEPILIVSRADERAEAEWITEKCLGLLGSGAQPKDIAVLYRANAQARAIELALREARINYRTFGGQSFFERKEVKDFLAYVRLIFQSSDRMALWRIINTPNRGLGLKTLERIESMAQRQNASPYKIIRSQAYEGVGSKQAASLQSFSALISTMKKMPLLSPEDFEAFGKALLKDSGLENEIKKTSTEKTRDRKLENLRALPQWLRMVAEDLQKEKGAVDKTDFLDLVALDNDRRSSKDKDGNYVSLMTVHAAKGLEFPAVFVAGVEEEQLPHKNSISDPKALCEERRLFYVALTRAKERLFLSYCQERSGGFSKADRRPSRFLKELPAETVTWQGENDAAVVSSTERRRTSTLSTLSRLREGLRKQ